MAIKGSVARGGQVLWLRLAGPAYLEALNGRVPFVGEQLAPAFMWAVGTSWASLSQPLKSPDYLRAAGHPLEDHPQQGRGGGKKGTEAPAGAGH